MRKIFLVLVAVSMAFMFVGSVSADLSLGIYDYYLPYYSSLNNNWTGLGLVNRNQMEATQLQVTVYDDSGNSLATENKIIPLHGQEAFPITTTLNNSGWMRVDSQQPLSGLAFIGLSGGVPLMADIPFVEELATSLVIPHIAQDDIWDTSILICNPVNKANNITLQLIGQDGALQGEEHIEIVALGSGEYDLSSLFAQVSHKSGKIKINASSGIAAFALYRNTKSGGSYCAGINAVDEGVNTSADYIYFTPSFVSGDGNWSGLGLSNENVSQPVSLKVTVYGQDGNKLTEVEKNLPANGQISLPVGTEITGRGWMSISSNQPLSGLAFLGASGSPALMADIPFVSKLEKSLIIPHIAEDKNWSTTVMFCNPQDQAVTVILKHINCQGVVTRQQDLGLPSKGSGSYSLLDLFGTPLTGMVYLEASQEIAACALYSNVESGGSYYAGINAVAMDAEGASRFHGKIVKITAKHSGSALTVDGAFTDDNAKIIQHYWVNGENQRFLIFDLGNGYVAIVAKNSGRALTVDGASTDDNAKIIQHYWHNGEHQKFKIERVDGGYSKIVAKSSGRALTVDGAFTDDNAKIIQHYWHNGEHQKFKIEVLEDLGKLPLTQKAVKNQVIPPTPLWTKDERPSDGWSGDWQTVGSTVVPFFMVSDPSLNLGEAITKSPYYKLERSQRWKHLEREGNCRDAETDKYSIEYSKGFEKTDALSFSTTLGVSVTAGYGGGLFPGAEFEATVSMELSWGWETSTTTTESTAKTRDYTIPAHTVLHLWQVYERFTLYRGDNTIVKEWILPVEAVEPTSSKCSD